MGRGFRLSPYFLCLINPGLLAQSLQDATVYIDSVLGRTRLFVGIKLKEVLRLAETSLVKQVIYDFIDVGYNLLLFPYLDILQDVRIGAVLVIARRAV